MVSGALAAAVLAAMTLAGRADAQGQPTVADIAACNEQAAAETSHPSAAPRDRPPGPGTSSPVPDARGGIPADRPTERPPMDRGPMLDPTPGGRVGEKTDPSGSIITQSPDPLLQGMDAERSQDPAYWAAYRRCMRGRIPGTR